MNPFQHERHFYQEIYFPLIVIYLLFTLSIGFIGLAFLNNQYTQKLKLLSNITGAVLSEDPAMETTLIDAMQDTEGHYAADGFAVLNKYGYREYTSMYEDAQYQDSLKDFFSLMLLFFILSFMIITVSFTLIDKNRKMQEKKLLNILDHCLTDDYSFLEKHKELGILFSEAFTDTLLKLGKKLMLKSQLLSEEHDNTKSLVTDISHQLKTPVSALKNCLFLSMEASSPKEQAELLERCSQQLTKLESLMEALINISRLETSMITLHTEETALSDILLDAVNTVYVKALQKNISVEVLNVPTEHDETLPDTLTLFLDRKWTVEALANILDNAVKYSPDGSAITVRLHKLFSYIRIEIEDTGIGIPKGEYNKIFRRFYRGSHPTIQHCDGSGVGLYLSRKIIEEQGGSITVKPAPRQGSIFVVQLPINSMAPFQKAKIPSQAGT